MALVAQFAVIVAETSRLPMVAGWDRTIPAWFTRLDPRWKTPTRSIAVIVGLSIFFGLLATYGTGAQEAFQVITSVGNIAYGIYYLMMFAIPLVVGEAIRGARRDVAEGGRTLRHCGHTDGDGVQSIANRRRRKAECGCLRARWQCRRYC